MKDKKDGILTRFINDVGSHCIYIERDDGVYRHLVFKRPRSNIYRFDITTWPGYLCVTGDMGTWTFSREYDMVTQFFNTSLVEGINPGYWSEKFEAGPGGGRRESPCYEFDAKAFDNYLQCWLADYLEDCGDDSDAAEAKAAISGLTGNHFQKQEEAFYEVSNACFPSDVDSYSLMENMDSMLTYSPHFLWICYAIVWGIERYNNTRTVEKAMNTFLAVRQSMAA